MAKVKIKTSMVGPAGDRYKGDIVEVSDREARRLIHFGAAEELEDHPVPKLKDPAAAKLERVSRVETASITHDQHGMETACLVRPAKRPKRGDIYAVPRVTVVPRDESGADELADDYFDD